MQERAGEAKASVNPLERVSLANLLREPVVEKRM
jgi:hypothetical protein